MTTKTELSRRALLTAGVAGVALSVFGRWAPATASEGSFEITLSEAEWRDRLTPEQFAILREEDTERPFTSALNDEKRKGMYHCAAAICRCIRPKRNSTAAPAGRVSGRPRPDAVRTKEDRFQAVSIRARKSIAAVAAAISATSSMTARRRPASVTASTAWR
jgi:peptide-methionine (R)-S-oxide reductase